MEVQLPRSSFTIFPKVFSPANVPFCSVSGHLAMAVVSSTGSSCSCPSEVSTLLAMSNKRGVCVQFEPNLISLIESTVSGVQQSMGELSAEKEVLGG